MAGPGSTLFQTPDDGILVFCIIIGFFSDFNDGIGQITVLPIIVNALILLLVSGAASRQQAYCCREKKLSNDFWGASFHWDSF
jgi:hypothetical protein